MKRMGARWLTLSFKVCTSINQNLDNCSVAKCSREMKGTPVHVERVNVPATSECCPNTGDISCLNSFMKLASKGAGGKCKANCKNGGQQKCFGLDHFSLEIAKTFYQIILDQANQSSARRPPP